MHSLHSFKQALDPVLIATLRQHLSLLSEYVPDSVQQDFLQQIVHIASDGKRVRPYVAWVMYAGIADVSDAQEDVLRLLSAIELFHLFALVHDDIMDQSPLRHGVATVHQVAIDQYHEHPQAQNVGEAQAILVGDWLLTLVHQLFGEARLALAANDVDAAHRVLITMSHEVVAGQMLDIDISTKKPGQVSLATLKQKNLLKTAGYTFIRPMQIGVALAGGSAEQHAACEQFGQLIGHAFQMQDDLLDITGDSTKTGKPVFSDMLEGQQTVLTNYLLEHGTSEQKTTLQEAFVATKLTDEQQRTLRQAFVDSGAIEYAEQEIAQTLQDAKKTLEDAPIPESSRVRLCTLLELLSLRTN